MWRTGILAFVVLGLAAAARPRPAAAGAGEPTVLIDFEQGEPADGWEVEGLGLSESTVPDGASPSAGRCLGIEGTEKGGWIHRPTGVSDWRSFRALSFFARVEASAPVGLRVAALEKTSFRSRLCRTRLEPGAWREVVIPLASFRWDFRRPPGRFDHVGRLMIQWDGGEGTVFLDDFRLLPGDRGPASCLPTVEEELDLAFPDGGGRAIGSEHFVVLTDVPALTEAAAQPLLERLEKGLDLLRTPFRVPGTVEGSVPLCVFGGDEAYRGFFARLGEHFRATVEPPTTDGYSALGYSATTWDPAQGAKRPVFVHEAMHAAILRLLHLGSTGDWIHEGLASAVQVRLHPDALEDDLHARFEARAKGEDTLPPLSLLIGTKRPGTARYPALLSFFEFLAAEHGDRLPAFWERIAESWKLPHESGRPALESALGMPIEAIGAEWIEWGRTHPW